MYEQLAPRNDRVQIQFGFDKVTIESLHDTDTVDRLLDLCVQAIRGLGFNFKHPNDEVAECERMLVRVAENVEGEDPDPTAGGDVADSVYRTIQKLLDERVEKNRLIGQLREENTDQRLRINADQLGIQAQKARIEELTEEVERLRVLEQPIIPQDGECSVWKLKKGTFLWAFMTMATLKREVRRPCESSVPGCQQAWDVLTPGVPQIFIKKEDFDSVGWEVVK